MLLLFLPPFPFHCVLPFYPFTLGCCVAATEEHLLFLGEFQGYCFRSRSVLLDHSGGLLRANFDPYGEGVSESWHLWFWAL